MRHRDRGSISEFKVDYVLFQEKSYAEGCIAKRGVATKYTI